MNKNDITRMAVRHSGLTIKDEQCAIDAFLCAISDILREDKEVVIPDFGRFSAYMRKERQVQHPKTGEIITVPASKRIRFKPFGNITNYRMIYGK